MRVFYFMVVFTFSLLVQSQDFSTHGSYYINTTGDTLNGLIKFNKRAKSFQFVTDDTWNSQQVFNTSATLAVRNGVQYTLRLYKKQMRFLKIASSINDTLYEYQKKKDRFYIDAPKEPKNLKARNRQLMRKKFLYTKDGKPHYINRFNHRNQLNSIFNIPKVLTGNCHFYELGLDILDL